MNRINQRLNCFLLGCLLLTSFPAVNLVAAGIADPLSGVDPDESTDLIMREISTENGLEIEGNRLPLLLQDLKVLMAEVLIADVLDDSMEVIFQLDQIFDLLEEAEQFGEMNAEDRDEFNRFEAALINIYSTQLQTIEKSQVLVSADQVSAAISEQIEPLEIEVGKSKFSIVDDREGHIPIVSNSQVERLIEFFQTKRKTEFEIWLQRYALYHDLILEILREYSLPEEIIYMGLIESGLNPKAYSRANAVGMWQFVYATGKRYGLNRTWWVDERRDPVKATHAACAHLRDLYDIFEDWYLVISAYNAGAGRIQRAIRLHQTRDFWQLYSLPRETRNHIPTFLAAAIICQNPEKYGFKIPDNNPFKYEEVPLAHSADINVLARSAGISASELRYYNPELRQSATPSVGTYVLKLPLETKAGFLKAFAALPENERFAPQYIVHKVRYGETLWDISKRYKVSIHQLAAVNKIRNRHKIRIGQKLTIPVPGQKTASTYAQSGPPGYSKMVYIVKKGDTLGHIAENYKTRASRIRRWNGLRYGQFIYPGQKLTLWIPQG